MLVDILTDFQDWFLEESITREDAPESEILVAEIDSSIEFLLPSSEEVDVNFEVDDISEPFSFESSDNYLETTNLDSATPVEDAQFWQKQNGANSCAVVAQISVFESITGEQISEDRAAEIAQANGWFDPEIGTRPGDVGKLLNELGIPTEQKYNATLEDIANALEKGDRVIVGLDANEIWNPIHDANGTPIEQANAGHAVWVTGMEAQPDGTVKLILNDSGHPNGKMVSVDARDFLNAWEDNGNFMVVANVPDRTVIV
jgi:hypothetical protein